MIAGQERAGYAAVCLTHIARAIDKPYTYSIPPELKELKIGQVVTVPFGKRKAFGFIVGFLDHSEVKGIRPITGLKYPYTVFSPPILELARWFAAYYLVPLSVPLHLILPPERFVPDKDFIAPAKTAPGKTILLARRDNKVRQTTYGELINDCLKQGRQVLYLLPEIAPLTSLKEELRRQFNVPVSIVLNDMKRAEEQAVWQQIFLPQAQIILGARSAVFTPLPNLGLIILEQEDSEVYKQEQTPKYHAREVAVARSMTEGATVVLGSAVPTVDSYFKAQNGAYELWEDKDRAKTTAAVEVVDMSKETGRNISPTLEGAMRLTLEQGRQIVLFFNRRGFATYVFCRECGKVVECPRCKFSLIYHGSERKLRCHHCGFSAPAPVLCPNCRNSNLGYFGRGTQKIEQEVGKVFPKARIMRLDADTSKNIKEPKIAFSAFKEGEADILVGTQMVIKEAGGANVGLVGVISADTALSVSDYRSSERTFQMLSQVIRIAGSHGTPDKIIVQTYNPDHYAIKCAVEGNYQGFYEEELKQRKELRYPPFAKLINLLIYGALEREVIGVATNLGEVLEKSKIQNPKSKIEILGPSVAPISRLRGKHRWMILLKGEDLETMRRLVRESLDEIKVPRSVRVTIDVDPLSII